MRKDEDLQIDVQDALKWEPALALADIGVSAKSGIVTLDGIVDSYSQKIKAEEIAKEVEGVRILVENIEIKAGHGGVKTDAELATQILSGLQLSWFPDDLIQVKVENGWVTLEGELNWNYQKKAAEKLIHNLAGVKGISNEITIKAKVLKEINRLDIMEAIFRNWSMRDQKIDVSVVGDKITLSGTVTSWYQREEAERIAWNAPGVSTVKNELVIQFTPAAIM